jgi:hypothetical protein
MTEMHKRISFPVAIVDVDDTLWSFCSIMVEKIKEINPNAGDIILDTWDSPQKYVNSEQFSNIVNEIHMHQDIYAPFTGAAEFLRWLKLRYYIILASHRIKESLEPLKWWCMTNGLVYNAIHLSTDKTLLIKMSKADLVIDDKPSILQTAYGLGIPCTGFKFKYNEYLSQIVPLVNSFDEMRKVIEGVNN